MKCKNPYFDKSRQLTFNCQKCMPCRINYTSQWALRCMYELASWNDASFITLTYNDEHLPSNYSLVPDHLKNFWKDLRYFLSLDDRKIKYYACGEYGDKVKKYLSPGALKCHGRPHYHAIVFGISPFSDDDRQLVAKCWPYCDSWIFSKNREEQAIDEVNVSDIRYVTGYVRKKLYGDQAKENYGEAVRPFSRCSQGLGLDFALKNKDRLVSNGFTFLSENKRVGIPKYFRTKFEVSAADLLKNVPSENRYKFEMEQNELLKLFERDMKKQKTWYPDNYKMLEIRFSRWLDNYRFTLVNQIQKDFEQRQRLVGKL